MAYLELNNIEHRNLQSWFKYHFVWFWFEETSPIGFQIHCRTLWQLDGVVQHKSREEDEEFLTSQLFSKADSASWKNKRKKQYNTVSL